MVGVSQALASRIVWWGTTWCDGALQHPCHRSPSHPNVFFSLPWARTSHARIHGSGPMFPGVGQSKPVTWSAGADLAFRRPIRRQILLLLSLLRQRPPSVAKNAIFKTVHRCQKRTSKYTASQGQHHEALYVEKATLIQP